MLYCEGTDWEAVVGIILGHAKALLAQGRWKTLQNWIANLPAERISADPWLLYWHGLAKMQVELTPMGDGFTWTSRAMDATQAKALYGWELAKQRIASGAFDIFLLDEFTYLLHFGWLETAEVLAWIAAHKPPMLHLMITGRDAPRALIEAADLVTEMREIKHPLHTQGIRAQKGIEF